ncbi:Zinc/iron permease [Martensiomyces pterosporus]|nr:Zinc/iron permease [Martensiomyces pterosporus]
MGLENNAIIGCGVAGTDPLWNNDWHIAALFIIIGTSAFGVFIPILSRTSRSVGALAIPMYVIQFGQFFGAGVIIATAFIHLFPAAHSALSSTCLGSFADRYSAWASLFAMAAVFTMHSIEWWLVEAWFSRTAVTCSQGCAEHAAGGGGGSRMHSSNNEEDSTAIHSKCSSLTKITYPVEVKRRALATYILELGIALYSVLIGLALAVSDRGFTALLIAVCFHQLFEGLALGTSLAELYWIKAQIAAHGRAALYAEGLEEPPAWISALAFTFTTPIGIIIGLALRHVYEPNSRYALLFNGVLQSICTGILIYAGLVTLMIGGFNSYQFKQLPRVFQAVLFFAVYAGAAAMASLKIWK